MQDTQAARGGASGLATNRWWTLVLIAAAAIALLIGATVGDFAETAKNGGTL